MKDERNIFTSEYDVSITLLKENRKITIGLING